ncbi:hypothetical protein IV38_GL001408 [Lactobacillus selangorensis]|uniref:Uncharacterized protein n=1 Tax=Lactobacillus selangorensis TaxID=81857 RepID=A0A0R2FII5_9LACO|nr:hypothetical protein [Lactobacillus selangorensis]KRN28408.1 hypothetical protein IV38_GL001408 [Lactobacillus selangorensis]KRN31909.1 hypothetical protein IV40_GL001195 [Lactobacillus selangorensis]
MSKRKAFWVFVFLFTIPYLAALGLSGTLYNALVRHVASWGRTIAAAATAAFGLLAIKIPLERPLRIIRTNGGRLTSRVANLFMVQNSLPKKGINYVLDFCLVGVATWVVRHTFTHDFVVGSLTGWLATVIFLSVCIGVYLDFDDLTIDRDIDVEND